MTTEAVRPPETAQFGRAESQSPEDVPGSPVNTPLVAGLIRELLIALGKDPQREGLVDTPARVASWWHSFLAPDSSAMATRFAETHASGQLVVVGGLNVWSLCEHHLLPMQLDAMSATSLTAPSRGCRSSVGSRSVTPGGSRCRNASPASSPTR
ncbi:GTP cyclohydrolase I [Nonomuraea fuscirosea]|uniref:GTP cyclohydrolase I n=1 Tax=Nonomuraea fuscirosea TaxID=1291556 RepID=UPI003435BBD1